MTDVGSNPAASIQSKRKILMANSKSADKRARQNKKRYELKHAQRSMVRTSVKATAKAVEAKDKKIAEVLKQLNRL